MAIIPSNTLALTEMWHRSQNPRNRKGQSCYSQAISEIFYRSHVAV